MWGILLLFISLFLYYFYISINNTLIILSIVCIIIQFIAIYWDSIDYAYTSKNIFDTGRDWHWNARILYLINGVILILSLLFFFNFYGGFYNPETIIWGLSAIVTFIAAVSAKPPIGRDQTSKISMKNIENIVYNYLKENKGSALTVSALGVRLENSVKTYNEIKYIRENLRMILNNLITSGKIDSTLHHEELHYFVADVYQKKVEELEPIPSIPEKIEEKPIITCPHCGQQIALDAKFCNKCGVKLEEMQPTPPISEKEEEKPITEVLHIKTEEVQPTSQISEVEKVITEVPQIKTEEIQRTPPISKKEEKKPISEVSHIKEEKEEAPKVAPSDELKQVPPISEIPQQEASEKAIIEVSQLKTEELEPVPSIKEVKEEAPKEYSYTCKFCGMKLTKKVNICPQCGTIIKL